MMIKNYKRLIKNSGLRKNALQIIDSGLKAIKTEKIIKKNIKLLLNSKNSKGFGNSENFQNKDNFLIIKNKKFNLKNYKNIYVIGFGKSSSLMAKELEKILGNNINEGIVISTKKVKLKKIKIIKGTHPMPSLRNIKATKKIINLIKNLDKNDLILCLVSGGGSALLCYPKLSFDRYMETINKHFASGINIKKLNKIRKKLSYVKGGKLAKLTKAKIISLIFSDVIGDDLSSIASGPTVGKNLKNVKNILLLNNQVALNAMYNKALSLNYKPIIHSNKLEGEARVIGKKLINKIKNKNCFLFAGETTVSVKGKGKGGRCQELCLGAIKDIAKLKDSCLIAIGTDGKDGPTDAAGAIIDNQSLKKAINKKLNYKKYLKNNDSYYFFKKMGDLVFTGLTGSNIADIGIILNHNLRTK